jgi:energy-converting hydrogenase Eha subunit B
MEKLIVLTGGVLLIALFIEVIFRMANSFSREAREGFRRVYIIGCGTLCVAFIWLGWRDMAAIRYAGGIGILLSTILMVSLTLSVLLNSNKRIK